MIVFLALISSVGILGELGVLMLQHELGSRIENQYRIDNCVSTKANSLVAVLNQIHRSSQKMKWLRQTIVLSAPSAPAVASLRVLLQGLGQYQIYLKLLWLKGRAEWFGKLMCQNKKIRNNIFRFALPYEFQIPDHLGPRPLLLKKITIPERFKSHFSASVGGRKSGAVFIFQESGISSASRSPWSVEWSL